MKNLGERAQQQQLGIIVCGGAVDTREREWQDIATSFNFYFTQSQMTVRLSIKSISSLNFFGDNTEVRVPRGSFRLCCVMLDVKSLRCFQSRSVSVFSFSSLSSPSDARVGCLMFFSVWQLPALRYGRNKNFVNPRGNSLTLLLWYSVYLNSENDES